MNTPYSSAPEAASAERLRLLLGLVAFVYINAPAATCARRSPTSPFLRLSWASLCRNARFKEATSSWLRQTQGKRGTGNKEHGNNRLHEIEQISNARTLGCLAVPGRHEMEAREKINYGCKQTWVSQKERTRRGGLHGGDAVVAVKNGNAKGDTRWTPTSRRRKESERGAHVGTSALPKEAAPRRAQHHRIHTHLQRIHRSRDVGIGQ